MTGYASAQDAVSVPGSFNSEIGCPDDWQPDCEVAQLTYDAFDDVWQGTFSIPAGQYEYKAAINMSWDENYGIGAEPGGDNIILDNPNDQLVKFYYDHKTHWVTDNVTSVIAIAPGNFQSELGCGDDWDPSCLRSWLQDVDGDGIYTFVTTALPPGAYEGKVAIDESWNENYGAGGEADGDNIAFTVNDGDQVTFSFSYDTKLLTITTEAVVVNEDSTATIAGSFQDELGCGSDWDPACENTQLTFDEEDGIMQGQWTIPAGDYEYKVAIDGSFDENYGQNGQPGGANIAFSLAEETTVKFYYNPITKWVTDNVSSTIATLPGSYQKYVGCNGDWDPGCLRSWLQDIDGDGIYTMSTTALPQGLYETKVAINESWNENYGENGEPGGANIPFYVPSNGQKVDFTYNAETRMLTIDSGITGVEPGQELTAKYAIIHYKRADGDYGDHTTGDYNDFWGLHLWGSSVANPTEWTAPVPFIGETGYGRFAFVELSGSSGDINFIVHRGDVKDGTDDDRRFSLARGPEIFLVGDDGNLYRSEAEVNGYVTIRYHRPDGNYGVGTENYWGLHLWSDGGNNAIHPDAETDWFAPRAADGVDDFGAYWNIPLNTDDPDVYTKPVKFILHTPGGDDTAPGGNREPGGDREFIAGEAGAIWLAEQDARVYTSRAGAERRVVLHYHRPEGDYGDFESDDFANFWGVHTWTGAAAPTDWPAPVRAAGTDTFGVYYNIPVTDEAELLNFIIHKGDDKDPGPDQALIFSADGYEVWQPQGADIEAPFMLPVPAVGGVDKGNLAEWRAFWVNTNTLVWKAANNADLEYRLYYSPTGGLEATDAGITGGQFITLELNPAGMDIRTIAKFPHLLGSPALTISEADMAMVPEILKGQIAISAIDADGNSRNATSIQIPGVLDAMYYYGGNDLGITWNEGAPSFALWAPTAKNVTFHVFDDANVRGSETFPMTAENGVWKVSGQADWKGKYYLYEVEVYVPSTGNVENNIVTDPYSIGLSSNSQRSLIMDLNDHKPEGWDTLAKPALDAPEDISIYEMHVRDFSIYDESVPADYRGLYKAFTLDNSNGLAHIQALADAGLTHLHLLPVFDIATINENKDERIEPDPTVLAGFAPDSDQQQATIAANGDADGFNWGYDPFHYNVPEGSYSSNPEGATRTMEFREMVQSINNRGMRVVMDVVYNHTNASGQNDKSVLDKVVPGYYHRLNDVGTVERSTCCDNTATEHLMMEKLMIDSLILWARAYKVDAFRFDLMGHHMFTNMQGVRNALNSLTVENDGVDGSKIYIYGEGWNFGEVENGLRGRNATQLNVGGLGIGTFSDRLRDAVRGGGPFDDGAALQNQGFANGLYYDPNSYEGQGDQMAGLLLQTDQIRVGMAGNLFDFEFTDRTGATVTGNQVDYNGQPAGYTQDPQEVITYISKHDNQTLYDINVYGAPLATTMDDRVRMQIVGLGTVMLGQGIPFFHAGSDILRSKSLDRDSFNSGDWFNRLDWTYNTNNFGVGLPVAEKNESNWFLMGPLLANPDLVPGNEHIVRTNALFRELLQIRYSSPLFRLRTGDDIKERVSFMNTGADQIPGLIAMHVDDTAGADLDPNYIGVMVIVNANDEAQTLSGEALQKRKFDLHPIQVNGTDDVVRAASYDRSGVFTIPARTVAVFNESVAPTPLELLNSTIDEYVAAGDLTPAMGFHLKRLLDLFQATGDGGYMFYFRYNVNRFVQSGFISQEQGQTLLDLADEFTAG
ncbi:MAG: pullulanase-type alpha-1,6-glucosidase [Acidobacteriota bacterium]|nr:pullulanase-type alpha-1,6-glucosidase [Acidobacteriota bacterium]